jgi:hypothetical protein
MLHAIFTAAKASACHMSFQMVAAADFLEGAVTVGVDGLGHLTPGILKKETGYHTAVGHSALMN